ncbi:MAG TPA: thiamine pyrophosphate-binding protein [Chloroflexota bacterium]|nr:thiamine pyrophosphate-binding protein [Chloroflexota bacterium]
MNNAELIARRLESAGVRWVFGVPSGPVLPLIEALRTSDVDYVLTASETSAGFMATTVGQLTGTPGVCVATLGPGATNLATGVGAAWLDRAPVLALTCNVPTSWLDRRVQMRIDHHALFAPIAKASLPLRTSNVASQLDRAFQVAGAEPPGPVHLDLPEDVALAPALGNLAGAEEPERPLDTSRATATAVLRALGQAQRTLVAVGLGFTRAPNRSRLLDFLDRQRIPFVTTMHAKGFLPESHPAWAGTLGRARRSTVQDFVRRADLVIAVGFDPVEINYEDWIDSQPVLHISTEVADVDPRLSVQNLVGDLGAAIERMAELSRVPNAWNRSEWEVHRARLDRELRPESAALATHHVVDCIRRALPPDGILAYDVGAHTHQIATQWRTDEAWSAISTNGWSSMGFGLPAAFAAKLVHPSRVVVGIVGDGCFQMTVGELALARRLHLAVPIVVLNDGWLGLIKVKQERKGYSYSGVELGPRVEPPAHYFGVPVRAARTIGELEQAVDWGLNLGGPSVIEAFVDVATYSSTVYD